MKYLLSLALAVVAVVLSFFIVAGVLSLAAFSLVATLILCGVVVIALPFIWLYIKLTGKGEISLISININTPSTMNEKPVTSVEEESNDVK